MGLLKAGVGAAGGVLADQWREYFYCEALDADTLVAKGEKRVGKRGSNTKGENNVISDGSIVAVADGQCMMIVENGAVVDVCAEPGEFVYDTGTEPSVFSGKLGDMVKKSFEQVGRRFTFGGDAGKDQRIYYFNTKEIVGNKYGTASPVPFRVVDEKIGLVLLWWLPRTLRKTSARCTAPSRSWAPRSASSCRTALTSCWKPSTTMTRCSLGVGVCRSCCPRFS